jgi:hypothetical protein
VLHFADAIDYCAIIGIKCNRDAAIVETDRVAERNELVRSLRSHHAGDDGGRKHRPFRRCDIAIDKTCRNLWREFNHRSGVRYATGRKLAAYVDHRRSIIAVYMAQLVHMNS